MGGFEVSRWLRERLGSSDLKQELKRVGLLGGVGGSWVVISRVISPPI